MFDLTPGSDESGSNINGFLITHCRWLKKNKFAAQVFCSPLGQHDDLTTPGSASRSEK